MDTKDSVMMVSRRGAQPGMGYRYLLGDRVGLVGPGRPSWDGTEGAQRRGGSGTGGRHGDVGGDKGMSGKMEGDRRNLFLAEGTPLHTLLFQNVPLIFFIPLSPVRFPHRLQTASINTY